MVAYDRRRDPMFRPTEPTRSQIRHLLTSRTKSARFRLNVSVSSTKGT